MGAPVGNKNAAKAKRWAAAIERALDRRAEKMSLRDAQEALDNIAESLLDAAAAGEIQALKEVGDRLDGKPATALTVSGDPENPLVSEIVRRVVKE